MDYDSKQARKMSAMLVERKNENKRKKWEQKGGRGPGFVGRFSLGEMVVARLSERRFRVWGMTSWRGTYVSGNFILIKSAGLFYACWDESVWVY